MAAAAKRSHKTLTIDQKIELLDKIGKVSYTILCQQYGIGRSTISDIKNKERSLPEYKRKLTDQGVKRPSKVMKLGRDEALETAVFLWFKQKRESRVPISGALLQAKARELHQRLCEAADGASIATSQEHQHFTASSGWLCRFCKCHRIRELSLQGEKLSADQPAAEDFVPKFREFVKEGQYSLDQVFNCDESGLYYKLMPKKSLAADFERTADGHKTQKERVTISACSNATGTIKLPLLLIGKAKNPRCFKRVCRANLPVTYDSQRNAWVNAQLFTSWFHNHFVPTAQAKLREMGLEPKAVLLLDNCSAHPNEEELVSADGLVVAKFLPPNVTSLIQPMDQGVLVSIKRRYRRKILEELILQDSVGVSIIDFLKGINLLKVAEMVAAAWKEVKENTLRLSWRKILPLESADAVDNLEVPTTSSQDDDLSTEQFQTQLEMLGQDMSENEIDEWLNEDCNDNGYEHMGDAETTAEVLQSNESELSDDDETSTAEQEETTPASNVIPHSQVVKMMDSCIDWFQQQSEANVFS